MKQPGFVASLKEELTQIISPHVLAANRRGGLTEAELVSLTTRMDADPAAYHPDHPDPSLVTSWDEVTHEDERIGEEAIADGSVAFVLLAGGLGSRTGQPKSFLRLPGIDLSLLGWKLLQAGNMPVWVMTAPELVREMGEHVSTLALPPGQKGIIFDQFESYRLTPDSRIAWLAPGCPDMHTLGHGDVGPALVESGVLSDNSKVKQIYVCNVDNVLASPHPGILGLHIRRGVPVTCELVDRQEGDRGGVLAVVNNRLQIAEDFRLPQGFADGCRFHNTNTMVIDTRILTSNIPWRWHRVRKHADGRIVVQYERLLQQYTEEFTTSYVKVRREDRYLPIRTLEDLDTAGKLLTTYRFK